MEALLQSVQFAHPIGLQLLVQQLLRPLPIRDPAKFIQAAFILQMGPIHLPSQPLTPIDADLDFEREPGLQPQVHPAELGMNEVVIQMRAFPGFAPYDRIAVRFSGTIECPAGFDAL